MHSGFLRLWTYVSISALFSCVLLLITRNYTLIILGPQNEVFSKYIREWTLSGRGVGKQTIVQLTSWPCHCANANIRIILVMFYLSEEWHHYLLNCCVVLVSWYCIQRNFRVIAFPFSPPNGIPGGPDCSCDTSTRLEYLAPPRLYAAVMSAP